MALCHLLLMILTAVALVGCGTTSHLIDISYMDDFQIEPLDVPNPALGGPYEY